MAKLNNIESNRKPNRPPKQVSSRDSRYFVPLILFLTAIVFANALGNDFVNNWDDNNYVLQNELIKHLNWENLKIMFSTFYEGNYHPLTLLSNAIEYKLFGLNPFYFHLDNVILHLLNVLLAFLFLKRFTGKFWVAAIASLFFAVHPMHVESVVWISERKDVLYSFFFLLSLLSYSNYLKTEKKNSYLFLSFLWFFLSLLSKPAAVCLPLLLVLMDYYHYKKLSLKNLYPVIPFFAMALFFGILAIYSQKSSEYIYDLASSFNNIDRFFLFLYSTVYYLFNAFFPFNLCALHYYPLKSAGLLPLEYYLSLPALLLLLFAVFKSGRFKQELIFGLLFYFITIVLVLQIIPVGKSVVSERYSYIPYIGIFFIIGQFFSYVKEREFVFSSKIQSIVPLVLVIFTILCSFLTFNRNKIWKNEEILFTDVIKKYPEHAFGWWSRAGYKFEKKDYKGAVLDLDKSEMLGWRDAGLFSIRGYAKVILNDYDGAFVDYNKAINLNPGFNQAFFNRGTLYLLTNKYEKAIVDFDSAIMLNPEYAEAFSNRGAAYAYQNKMDKSLKDFNTAIKLNPVSAEAYFSRGFTKLSLNDKKGACQDWHSAQKLGYTQANDILRTYCD